MGDLEKGQTKLTTLTQNKKDSDLNGEEIFKMVENQTSDLQNQVTQLKNELRDTKEMLMKLQSFSMETNQKIISIVLTQEKQETLLKEVEVEDSEPEVEAGSDSSLEENLEEEIVSDDVEQKEEDEDEDEDEKKPEKVELKPEQVASKPELKKSIKNELLKINSDDV